MKSHAYRRFLIVAPALMVMAMTGCHEDDSDVAGILAIIYAVGDLVIGIIQVAS